MDSNVGACVCIKPQEKIAIHKDLRLWVKEATKQSGAKSIGEFVNALLRKYKLFGEVKKYE